MREMDFPRYKALQAVWRDTPPVHLSVAAYLGIRAKGGPGGEQPVQPVQPVPPSQTAGAILDDLINT